MKNRWFVFLFIIHVYFCWFEDHALRMSIDIIFVHALFEFLSGMKFDPRWRASTCLTLTTTTRRWTEPAWPVVLWLNGPLHRCVRWRFKITLYKVIVFIFYHDKVLLKCTCILKWTMFNLMARELSFYFCEWCVQIQRDCLSRDWFMTCHFAHRLITLTCWRGLIHWGTNWKT